MEKGYEEIEGRLFSHGVQTLTDADLLALLLRVQNKRASMHVVAEQLLKVGGGLKMLCDHEPQEFCERTGVKPKHAAQLMAAMELGRRAQMTRDGRPRLTSPKDIYEYLRPHLAHRRKEAFHVLCLNARNVLLKDAVIAEGTMNACPVDPREVFHAALVARATAIVLAHNHPSGDSTPSAQDVVLTRQLVQGGALLGIRVLDHLVVGDGEFTSFVETGTMPGHEFSRTARLRHVAND